MKKNEVKVGCTYVAKVSDRLVPVRIDSVHSKQGWNATNTKTGKRIHVKSAQRLRHEAKPTGGRKTKAPVAASDIPSKTARAAGEVAKAEQAAAKVGQIVNVATKAAKPAKVTKEVKPKRISALDAAAAVLADADAPMTSKALIETMAARGLWSSPNGKTPHATLYAAILREIKAKGADARFRKVERGQFAAAS